MADIFQIVKYEGDNSTFIWKAREEDFNTGTQLIVHESQEAVFFMNGQALDLFGPGRHTLETQNIPLVRKFFNKPTNDQTPFHCEVYFVNKTEQMAIKWGTDSQVQYMEPTYKFPLKIGASGEMSLRVEDSRKLLVKVVGTGNALGQASLMQMFRAFLMARVKPYLAQTMQGSTFGIFEIDSRMGELSEVLHKQLMPDFADYGLSLERFFVTTIVKPDGDKAYEKSRDIHIRQYADIAEAQLRQKVGIIDQQTSAEKMQIEAEAIAKKTVLEGKAEAERRMHEKITKQEELASEVARTFASNEAVGGIANTGIGLGMMMGAAGGIGAPVAGIVAGALGATQGVNGAGPAVAGIGIVPPAPTPPAPTPPDGMAAFKQKIEKLKMMKEAGMLSDEEFDAQRKDLLNNL
ncbi:MAG: SPFH domain-containing protein [Kiritimatiellaeota bacterium]|nr:SPFH domain-containing protein [Kiritimatiellota bacterium]